MKPRRRADERGAGGVFMFPGGGFVAGRFPSGIARVEHGRSVTRMICRTLALCLVFLSIVLIAVNIALILVGVTTGQILNPSFRVLLGMTLLAWIAGFALAGLFHLASSQWFKAIDHEARCPGCDYDLRGSIGSPRCPECGMRRKSPDV